MELSGSHMSAAKASSGVPIRREFVKSTAIVGNLSLPIPCHIYMSKKAYYQNGKLNNRKKNWVKQKYIDIQRTENSLVF